MNASTRAFLVTVCQAAGCLIGVAVLADYNAEGRARRRAATGLTFDAHADQALAVARASEADAAELARFEVELLAAPALADAAAELDLRWRVAQGRLA